MALSSGALHADGSDHAGFPSLPAFSADTDLVISNRGSPMLMQTSMLRGLFSAGPNVSIGPDGVISTSAVITGGSGASLGSAIGGLQLVSGLSAQDLVAVSHAGSDSAIPYGDFLGGVTIDQAQHAGPVGDTDTFWVAQGSNVMVSQNFSSIWQWIANKLPSYRAPVVEVISNINLDGTVHNGRTLVCSQPVTITPLTANMGSGFQCVVVNASSGNVTLGGAFVSSTGSKILAPWQSASLSSVTYSGGTIAFASMPGGGVMQVPGQVTSLSSSGITAASITVVWSAPSSGGLVSSYILQYRPTGTTTWSSTSPIVASTTYQIIGLQPGTSYDVVVAAVNTAGSGAASAILTTATSGTSVPSAAPPSQVLGLAATPTSSNAISLIWTAQSGANAASSFTVQYRKSGLTAWTSTVANLLNATASVSGLLAATSYDFVVSGVNASGTGPASTPVTATTLAASQSVSSITWNFVPGGTYTHATGSIGVNAHVSPAASPIQFGFSLSASTPPSSWTAAVLVNTDLWGAYLPTPATPGNWYLWAEGLDGSAPAVSSSLFVVQ